jgi:hypothetical protein
MQDDSQYSDEMDMQGQDLDSMDMQDQDQDSMDSQGGGDMEEPEDVAGGMMDSAPDSSDEEQDEFSENEESIRNKINDAVGSPEEGDLGDEEIELPENENADLDNDQDPALASADDDMEAEAFNQMNDEAGAHISGMKQQVAEALMAFKAQKDQLEAMQQQAPELYSATLTMLQTMLDLSKALFGEADQSEPEMPQDMEQPQEESPDMSADIPNQEGDVEEEFLPKQ